MAAMRRIRRECPWDRGQTMQSLTTYTVEEVYELVDAVTDGATEEVRKELGDMLMHVAFYSVIAEEGHLFTLEDVIRGVTEKIIYRHPHVFANTGAKTPEEVEAQWEALKLKEKGRKKEVMQGVPSALPPLTKAYRMQEKARAVGFDWNDPQGAWDKLAEEIAEAKEAIALEPRSEHVVQEFGDILFTAINAARMHGVDPAYALELSNRKFQLRFNLMEKLAAEQGKAVHEMDMEALDALWEEAKRQLRDEVG